MRAALAVLLLLAAPVWAAPERSPRPEARPIVQIAPQGHILRSPRPPSRPAMAARIPSKGGAICGVAGLTGRVLDPVTSATTGCGVEEPVRITAVQGVRLSMPLVMDCTAARALDQWVGTVLQPTFAGRVRRLEVAGAYVCRGRNNQSGAKISEHGRGRAVDVSGLTFTDGSRITVAADWNQGRDGRLMARAYKAACGIFGTTLGPGSDGYHEDHMHFDVPLRRRSPYCR